MLGPQLHLAGVSFLAGGPNWAFFSASLGAWYSGFDGQGGLRVFRLGVGYAVDAFEGGDTFPVGSDAFSVGCDAFL